MLSRDKSRFYSAKASVALWSEGSTNAGRRCVVVGRVDAEFVCVSDSTSYFEVVLVERWLICAENDD